jgi:hypothetical protein
MPLQADGSGASSRHCGGMSHNLHIQMVAEARRAAQQATGRPAKSAS